VTLLQSIVISYFNSTKLGKMERNPHHKFVFPQKHFLFPATVRILLKSIHLLKTFYQK